MARSSLARCIYFLILFCILEQDLVSGTLRGSCIEAGYTECCSDGCYAAPFACSCDPVCETYEDCCHDIYELCNPAVERAHNAYRPSVVYLENITFHTAVIHWIVTPGPTETINGSYEVALYKGNDASNYSNSLEDTLRSSVYYLPITVNVTEANRPGRTFHIPLADLDQDTTYTYKIGIISDVKTIENVHGGSFKTAKYPSIEENVTLELTADPSSVLVTWVGTNVPSGVNIIHYKVKYAEKTEEAPVGVVRTSSPEEVSLIVEGLTTHRNYVFRVSVAVRETNGGVYEFGGSENGQEIFVPDMSDFQLVAKSSISCVNWNMQGGQQVACSLRSKLLDLLEESCPTIATFLGENLLNEAIIPLCKNDSAIHITYRASLIGIEGCSSHDLVNSIDVWRLSARVEPVAANGISFKFSQSVDCPTRIDHHNSPLCMVVAEAPTCAAAASVFAKSVSQECPITTIMLVAYLMVEFSLVTVFYLSIALATVYIIRIKRKLSKDSDPKQNEYTVPTNVYAVNRNSMSSQEEGFRRSYIHSEMDESDLDQAPKINYML